MVLKQTAHGKTAYADSMELFVLTFAPVAVEFPRCTAKQ